VPEVRGLRAAPATGAGQGRGTGRQAAHVVSFYSLAVPQAATEGPSGRRPALSLMLSDPTAEGRGVPSGLHVRPAALLARRSGPVPVSAGAARAAGSVPRVHSPARRRRVAGASPAQPRQCPERSRPAFRREALARARRPGARSSHARRAPQALRRHRWAWSDAQACARWRTRWRRGPCGRPRCWLRACRPERPRTQRCTSALRTCSATARGLRWAG
jgi:hypothetical protein